MFNSNFPTGFGGYQSMGSDPYNQVNGMGQVSPYAPSPFLQGMSSVGMMNSPSIGNMDQYNIPMPGNDTESQLYPMENSDSLSSYTSVGQPAQGFARGGRVRRHFKGGGLFGNPMKWLASNIGPALGVAVGNALLPGIGGALGGALGGAAGSALRGRKDYGQSALRGLGMGAIAPTVAGLAGSGATALGAPGIGQTLSSYGEKNAIFPAIDRLVSGGKGMVPSVGGGWKPGQQLNNTAALAILNGQMDSQGRLIQDDEGLGLGVGAGDGEEEMLGLGGGNVVPKKSFFEKLIDDPKNLLAMASIAGQYMAREKPKKEKSGEELGREVKAYQLATMLNPEELTRKEAYETELAKAAKRSKRNSYLPEERLGDLKMVYPHTLSPEEAAARGRYIEYYDNPSFAGNALPYAHGGSVPKGIMMEEIDVMPTVGNFLRGNTKGQDDEVRRPLEEGGYVLDASTMSDLGDGNSEAGNGVIDAWLSDGERALTKNEVKAIGHGDHTKGVKKLNKMRQGLRKHKRGGETKLPPKAKPIEEYTR